MPDQTLTINHADGGSETYTINRDEFESIRNMVVDGGAVSVDHTPPPETRTMSINGSPITISRATGGDIRTITIDSQEVTINRSKTLTSNAQIISPYYVSGGYKVYQPDGQSLYLQPK
jgi:hypothetical protein